MIFAPKTIEAAMHYRYNKRLGNSFGIEYNELYCAAEVVEQCSRRNGHGPDGLYCRQHAKMLEKKE